MKTLLLCMMLVAASTPAFSQTRPKATRADPCAPIGQTANRELVYPMSCNNLPAPPPPPQAEVQQAPAAEPETPRTGLFGMSFDRLGGSGGQGRSQ